MSNLSAFKRRGTLGDLRWILGDTRLGLVLSGIFLIGTWCSIISWEFFSVSFCAGGANHWSREILCPATVESSHTVQALFHGQTLARTNASSSHQKWNGQFLLDILVLVHFAVFRTYCKSPYIAPWGYMKISARFGGLYSGGGYIRDLFCMCPNVQKRRSFIRRRL